MTVVDSAKLPAIARPFPQEWRLRPRLYTLCTTFRCNLACDYCYVRKNAATMSLDTAQRALDFIFHHSAGAEIVDIGFFGGEPLQEFSLTQEISEAIEKHPAYDPEHVSLTITTNGTLFTDEILAFFKAHGFKVCVSCDGPPHVQDIHRRTADGRGTSAMVEQNLIAAQKTLGNLAVNAVYTPQTYTYLPETVDYFSSLGLRHISLSPDFSAAWSLQQLKQLPQIYRAIADRYVAWYRSNDPHYIDLIDSKVSVLLRGGYHPLERCLMGTGELTFTPDGGLYPCERLVGSGGDGKYRIGTIETGIDAARLKGLCAPGSDANPECLECSMRSYCVNWCGCSNIFMTGFSNRVGPFLCASERAAIGAAMDIYTGLAGLIAAPVACGSRGRPMPVSAK